MLAAAVSVLRPVPNTHTLDTQFEMKKKKKKVND